MAYLVSRWAVLDSLSCVDSFVVIGIGKGTKKLGTFLDCTKVCRSRRFPQTSKEMKGEI